MTQAVHLCRPTCTSIIMDMSFVYIYLECQFYIFYSFSLIIVFNENVRIFIF